MQAVVVWWDLHASTQTIDSLRTFLRDEAVPQWAKAQGLHLKFWISDPEREWWGAVLLFESAEAADAPMPTRAAQLIGYPPTSRLRFDVEATTEGIRTITELAGHGLAFTSGG